MWLVGVGWVVGGLVDDGAGNGERWSGQSGLGTAVFIRARCTCLARRVDALNLILLKAINTSRDARARLSRLALRANIKAASARHGPPP